MQKHDAAPRTPDMDVRLERYFMDEKIEKLEQSNYRPWQIIAPAKSAFLPSLAVRLLSWAMLQG